MHTKKFFKHTLSLAVLAAVGFGATAAHADFVYKLNVPNLQVKPGGSSGGGSTETPKKPGSLAVGVGQLNFGEVDLGGQARQTFTVSNPGDLTAFISGISIAGGSSDFAISSNTCGSSLRGGVTCQVSVDFQPAARGDRAGEVSVEGTRVSNSVLLGGFGVAPATLVANLSSVTFGASSIGATSAETQAVTLNNTGDRPLVISSVSIPTGSDSFTATPGCVGTIAAGAACSLTVGFKPQSSTNNGILRVVSNAANAPTADLPLSGAGLLPPSLGIDVNAVTFAGSGIGATSAEVKNVTVTNTGDAPLTINSVTVTSGGTAFSATGCVGALSAGSSCAVKVSFTPQATTNTGTLRIVSNAPSNPSKDVALSGVGSPSAMITVMTANPSFASWAIGYKSTETKQVILKNTGTAPLTISAVAFTPATTAFANTGNCVLTLAANATCTLNMSFTPRAANNTANLSVTSNAVNKPSLDIPASGTGRTAGLITVTRAVYNLNATIGGSGNLTTNLRNHCANKSVCSFDPFAVLGTDPSPDNPKGLAMTYTCSTTGGTVHSYNAGAEAGLRQHTITCP